MAASIQVRLRCVDKIGLLRRGLGPVSRSYSYSNLLRRRINAIVQQCVAIDDSPSQTGLSRSERLGDVNVYDGEDGNEALMEDDGYVHMFTSLMLWDKLCISDNDSAVIATASGYDEDPEDGPGDCTQSSSDPECAFDEDQDEEVLEIRTPSLRRSSKLIE